MCQNIFIISSKEAGTKLHLCDRLLVTMHLIILFKLVSFVMSVLRGHNTHSPLEFKSYLFVQLI